MRPEAFGAGVAGSDGDVHRVFGTVPARVEHEAFVATLGKDRLAPHGFTGAEVLLYVTLGVAILKFSRCALSWLSQPHVYLEPSFF